MKESSRRTILLKIVARGPVGHAVVEIETVVQPTDDPSSAVRFVVGGISEQARHAPLGHVELRAFESVTAQHRTPISGKSVVLVKIEEVERDPHSFCPPHSKMLQKSFLNAAERSHRSADTESWIGALHRHGSD